MSQPRAHVSIDLETLSTSPAAVILAVGAYAICEETGNFVRFYRVCSTNSQPHRQIDPSTLQWWENQSAEARKVLDEATSPDATPLEDVLDELTNWVGLLGNTHQVYVWGNGAAFEQTLTYESSDTNVATVSAAGVVTGVAVGEAVITISLKDSTVVAKVPVNVTTE